MLLQLKTKAGFVVKPYRIYIDTSVVGGCLEDEFAEHSRRLLEAARTGHVVLLVSSLVVKELASAPPEVRAVLGDLPACAVEEVELDEETVALRDAYVAAGVVGERHLEDAWHVAAATVARAAAIASWNFRHIVRLDRMRGYCQVNILNGYGLLMIVSPREVGYGDEQEE